MINLLSVSAKKQLWNQYLMRLGTALFLVVILLELFSVALFLPAFYAVHSTTGALAHDLEQRRIHSPEENKIILEEVKQVRAELDLLRPTKQTPDRTPSSFFEGIVAVRPKGITINSLAYTRTGELVSIQLSGVAANRDDILIFKNELSKNPLFQTPKSGDYITKKTNIPFSIVLVTK